jgi:hypothetical protein
MPEWKALVRERLGNLGLGAVQEEAIVAELASHLEEIYDEACAQGFCKSEAIERSLAQVTGWQSLSKNIQNAKRKEGIMNYRTKTLWLPGLISLTAAMVFLMLSELISLQPRFLSPAYFPSVHAGSTSANILLVAYLPWLALLPFCGAAGAFLSRRAGGRRPVRFAAGMFPWTTLFLLVTFLTLIGQIVPFKHEWLGFVTKLLLVSVPPAIALLLGVIPFLKEPRPAALASAQR